MIVTVATASRAEDDDGIVTDRPDFVESSLTVGKGRVQIETSVLVESNKDDSAAVKTHTLYTPTLLRVGFTDNWEARIETDGLVRQRTTDLATDSSTNDSGASDVELGLKWHVIDGKEGSPIPSTALLLHVGLNTGSTAYRAANNVPSLRATMEWELPNDYGLGIMVGAARQKDANLVQYTEGILGIVFGKNWTPALRTFVEVAGTSLKSKTHGGSEITWDVGINWVYTKYSQIDAALLKAANGYTPDLAFTVGFSTKF
jgi:hypothetical protein